MANIIGGVFRRAMTDINIKGGSRGSDYPPDLRA
ncbi:cytochrome P450 90A1 [Senna tora]|uniref:Cytochrome P450 90A1 n=1 Tax=Senna tora TaxID=362788 RepID=A0A834TSZ3_9FABA|nr:cytochrome P450 90A1 [Senna tora]